MTSSLTDTLVHTLIDPDPDPGTPPPRPRVLVAGIGNIFLGDDGFGVEVVGRLAGRPMPDGVTVVDFGIRGLHLAYQLLDGYDVLVLVDALPLGEPPGTVALVEAEVPTTAEPDPETPTGPALDAHSMSPAVVLATLAHLGGSVDQVFVVGCQPATVAEVIGLSDAVAASVDRALAMVDDLLADLTADPDLLTNDEGTEPPP
ncbi:hydrogenase maturation protease [Iamia sp.]|uniref:hydrogenase maturation protease n=1 Tax=Iamia sp. TaxID=2722710 RepID=UPI002BA461B0|nr:hydrogenase maturation protease [Iamia sp.]HXH56622.1 hydrogenase maturation protease [Iamia sp.]